MATGRTLRVTEAPKLCMQFGIKSINYLRISMGTKNNDIEGLTEVLTFWLICGKTVEMQSVLKEFSGKQSSRKGRPTFCREPSHKVDPDVQECSSLGDHTFTEKAVF
jgi:hypothetical protein